jgi:hypothetical protein
MRNRGRGRNAGRGLPATDPGRKIVSIAQSGLFIRVTTAAPHGLAVGRLVDLTGTSVEGYHTTHGVTAVTSTTFDTSAEYTADATGGAWH